MRGKAGRRSIGSRTFAASEHPPLALCADARRPQPPGQLRRLPIQSLALATTTGLH